MTQHATKKSGDLLRMRLFKKRPGDKGILSSSAARALAILSLALIFATLGGAGYVAADTSATIVSGVQISSVEVGGLTGEEAHARIAAAVDELRLTYENQGERFTVTPASADATATGPLVDFHVNAAVAAALDVGRDANPFISLYERARAKTMMLDVGISYTMEPERLMELLQERFRLALTPARDARLAVTIDGKRATVVTEPEAEGLALNDAQVLQATHALVSSLSAGSIPVAVSADLPQLTTAEVTPLEEQALALLAKLPFRLAAGDEAWTLDAKDAASWIVAVPQPNGASLIVDEAAVAAYLAPRAELLAQPPRDAVFTEKDGRATEFVPSQEGTKLDMQSAVLNIIDAFFAEAPHEGPIELPIVVDPPKISTADANPYGIRELIGVGESNFKGSPVNRRSNIDVGRRALDGVLIHPGEEFSLLKTLGPIDGEHGYLEELVIKENKTTPEFGGGLCQIGTTTFRAVLDSGLPVLARRNHSYRVTYYERDGDGNYMGPGKDATIYDPAPDFKFTNDTPSSILIRTRVEGRDKLVFEFWGAKDGRVAEQTDAVILKTTPPPPKKEIKTTDIPAGTYKCTESPHAGATVYFDYTVTYPSGDKKEERFNSYYRPWGEVCLIGVTQEELDAAKASGEVGADGVVIPPPAPVTEGATEAPTT